MKVFLLVVMMCSPQHPSMCRTVSVENHPGRTADSREECREASREHVLSFFEQNEDIAVYRGHDCKLDTRGDTL